MRKPNELTAPAQNRRSQGSMVGLRLGVSYDSIDIDGASPAISMDGFGFGFAAVFDAHLGGNLGAPLSLGIHYVSLTGQSETVRLTATTLSLMLEGALMYRLTPSLRLGGFASYGFGLSGEIDFESQGRAPETTPLESSSRLPLGVRGMYYPSTDLALGLDLGLLNGELVLEPKTGTSTPADNQPSTHSGLLLRLIVEYFL